MTFLNVVEIESALAGLHNAYPALTQLFELPNETAEHRRSHALLIRGGGGSFACRPAFVFVSGVHAREWGGPDILVNLAADVLEAYSTGAGLAYGGKSFTSNQLKQIVERTDIVVFPDINPDGRAYSMGAPANTGQAMWRKNRNTASSNNDPSKIGVDVNRNYDFLWNFPVAFSPAANPNTLASTDPASDLFHGMGPFSEPESRNVRWLVEQFNTRYFVDVHSYTGDVLHPWGSDENQTTDPSKSYSNPAWNGLRGVAGDAYQEYIKPNTLATHQAAAGVIRDGINAVRNQGYVAKQGFWLWAQSYPTSGASEDWGLTRGITSFVIEFNKNTDFFPTWAEMELMIADVDAGLLALTDWACPTWWQVLVCWIRQWFHDHLWAPWKKLWPKDLWGPYGPWTRFVGVVEQVVRQIFRSRS